MSLLVRATAYVVYLLLVVPIVFVIGASLTAGNYIGFPPQGLSIRWYLAMVADSDIVEGIRISLELGLAATALSILIGTPAALALDRLPPRWRDPMASLLLAPLSVPLVLTGFAMLVMFTELHLVNLAGLVIGHVVVTVPYVLRTALVSLSLSDRSLPRAAAIFGAGAWQTFRHATLPTLRPGLLAGGFFAFLSSFNNVTISIFLSSPGSSPLPVVIFNRMDNLAEPTAAAAASTIIILTAACVLLLERRLSVFRSLAG